jgi:hypothetical protein
MPEEAILEAFKLAEQVTGVPCDPEIAGMGLERILNNPGWNTFPSSAYKIVCRVVNKLTEKFKNILPLKKVLPDVRNTDLLDIVGYYTYLKSPRSSELVGGNERFLSRYAEELTILINSGYSLREIADISARLYENSALSNISKTIFFLSDLKVKFGTVSKAIPVFEDLVKVAISIESLIGYLSRLSKRYKEKNTRKLLHILWSSKYYVDIYCDETEFDRKTAINLIEHYIPCPVHMEYSISDFIGEGYIDGDDFGEYISTLADEGLVSIDEEGYYEILNWDSTQISFFYWTAVGSKKRLATALKLHKEVFDLFSRLLLETEFSHAVETGFDESGNPNAHWDFAFQSSEMLRRLIADLLGVSVVKYVRPDDAIDLVLYLERIKIFLTGMVAIFSDPYKAKAGLRAAGKVNAGDMFELILDGVFAIEKMDVLASFPEDLAAGILKNMPAEEIYTYIVSRGGVVL